MGRLALFVAALLTTGGAARAQTVAQPPASTLAAAPATPSPAELPPICTDRPVKANLPCTVPAGHFQYEADVFNATVAHQDGATTDLFLLTNPTLKYGLTPSLDVEANISPYEVLRTRTDAGAGSVISGVGDLYLRLKYEFLDVPGFPVQAAIIPYIKVPTARMGLGNGAVEGGLLAPIGYSLSPSITLDLMPEIDNYIDAAGGGRHLNTSQILGLAVSVPRAITLYAEMWGDWNFDPAGTVRQYSADVAASIGVTRTLQFDAGLNLGLNRQTPGFQGYFGVSQRF